MSPQQSHQSPPPVSDEGTDEPPSCASRPRLTEVEVLVDADLGPGPGPGAKPKELDSAASSGIDPAWLRARLRDALPHLPARVARVTVRVVSDATMAALHERHCGDPTTTDVLTFPDEPAEPDGGELPVGVSVDIAICADEASRAVAARGHALRDELLLYAVHGLLHCCGHDDHDSEAFALMHAEEDRILAAIGVGAVFASGDDQAGEESSGGRPQ